MIRSASSGSTASSGGGRRTKPSISSRSSACSGRERGFGALASGAAERQPGLDLEPRLDARPAGSERCRFRRRDEERLPLARLDRRSDQAELEPAQPLEPAQALDDVLERLDAIPQPGSLLVAEALGQVREPLAQAR